MRKSRFTEARVIGMIEGLEAGLSTAALCRKDGLSQGMFYRFTSTFGGMEVSDACAVTDENARLKCLLADAMLDNAVLKDPPGKTQRHRLSGARQR